MILKKFLKPVLFVLFTAAIPSVFGAGDPLFTEAAELIVTARDGSTSGHFPALKDMRTAWGDIDGDGDFDLIIMGAGRAGPVTAIYENVGDAVHPFSFIERDSGLPQLQDGAMVWGDFDNDGDLDLAITGATNATPVRSDLRAMILRNNGRNASGGWTFENVSAGVPWFTPCRFGTVAWGDMDNDGNLDLFVSGSTSDASVEDWRAEHFSRIYRNEGGLLTASGPRFLTPEGLKAEAKGEELKPYHGYLTTHVTWADINKDTFMDLILTTEIPTSLSDASDLNGGAICKKCGSTRPAPALRPVILRDWETRSRVRHFPPSTLVVGPDPRSTHGATPGRGAARETGTAMGGPTWHFSPPRALRTRNPVLRKCTTSTGFPPRMIPFRALAPSGS